MDSTKNMPSLEKNVTLVVGVEAQGQAAPDYQKPGIVLQMPLEAVASVCSLPLGKAPLSCANGNS
jgi:hypothetical protein